MLSDTISRTLLKHHFFVFEKPPWGFKMIVTAVTLPPPPRVGDDGRIFPGHPSPILHAPRDNISHEGKFLTPTRLAVGFV